ncbi:hypothetical protein [Sinirhodobacter huangdaonensis]|uniref:Uncharacterized protein n=1 Tax=Paenirhodobacter huangdaonensis TaxID=2501515 RepID=A0A3S4MFF3_9RHOB|nr:hypothetical protein [Sinirhodobacter huangdaonensis]RWR50354.1 hypothetical protein EOW66_15235 [Sinirhodobacter huangdaonensis]
MKTIVTFTRHWGRYNAGDTAGFEAKRAAELVRSGVAVEGAGRAKTGSVTLDIDVANLPEMQEAIAGIAAQAEVLAAREAELAKREADLVAREVALAETEAPIELVDPETGEVTAAPPPAAAPTEKGAPPAQGKAAKG